VRESPDALQALTEAIGTALRADAAIVRFREEGSGDLVARTVWATSRAFSAELVGSRHAPDAGPDPNGSIMRVPIRRGDEVVGELEVMRLGDPFGEDDSSLASSAAAQAGLDRALVDAAAMALLRNPRAFDVIVTENTFGDILTDEAAMRDFARGHR